MPDLDDLLTYIFDGRKSPFYREFERWLRGSRRFRAFASTHRDKIRSKLRNALGGGLDDVRAELATAVMLLSEDRFTLEYERYAALKQRGPDFTVTFRTHTPINVEVRRIRPAELGGDDNEMDGNASEVRLGKLMTVMCDKAGQMQPGIVNLLWLTIEVNVPEKHLTDAVTILRQLAEHKDEAFFVKNHFPSAAAFVRQLQCLSAIVLCQPGGNVVWQNPQAHHKAPPEVVTAIRRLGPPA